ncbi:MAG: serine/threonine-protein kinase [Sphingobacteriales bacterium]|nr:serine/threonine-protein kinase [Sphingobacteriales bacterium]
MKFRERYIFDSAKDFIGKGGFAKVFRAYDTIRKRYVALKFYAGTESEKYDIISEINRMDNLAHPNLIRYYDATFIDSVNAIGEKEQIQVGIMEFANAGDISLFFKKTQPTELTRQVILDILSGLAYLHENGIAHRDMKPKNILLSEENGRLTAKIADFGISKKVEAGEDASVSSQLLGSVEYMAPEQFAPAVYGIAGKLGTNADIWSLGIILYEIFTARLPFGSRTKGITYEQILNNILFQDLDIDYNAVPEPYRSVIRRCLVKNAAQRAQSANELIAIIEGKTYQDTCQQRRETNRYIAQPEYPHRPTPKQDGQQRWRYAYTEPIGAKQR